MNIGKISKLTRVLLFIVFVLTGLVLALALGHLIGSCTESRSVLWAQRENPGCEIWTLSDNKLLVRCPFKTPVVVGGIDGFQTSH